MTPNEAYFQQTITTKAIKGFDSERIRQRVVELTKQIGIKKNKNCGHALEEGDHVLVKTTMRIKIRSDGQRLIIPPKENNRHFKYGFKATIQRIRGNCYDLKWG